MQKWLQKVEVAALILVLFNSCVSQNSDSTERLTTILSASGDWIEYSYITESEENTSDLENIQYIEIVDSIEPTASSEMVTSTEQTEFQVKKASLEELQQVGLEDSVIDWKDENLKQAMIEITGISEREIRLSDVWHIRQLNLNGKGIVKIDALGNLRNLESLSLSGNEISDITDITNIRHKAPSFIYGDIR